MTESLVQPRCIGYARVSSREQAFGTHALEQQVDRLKKAGATDVIVDVQSGKRDDRKGLKKILALVTSSQVDEVLITRIDRFGRSVLSCLGNIKILFENDVNLRALDQQLDFSTPEGKLMASMVAVLAEWEVDQLKSRVQHGQRFRREQHKPCGSTPWGYTVENERYILDQRQFLCLLSDQPDDWRDYDDQTPIDSLLGRTVKDLARDVIDSFFREKSISRTRRYLYEKYGQRYTKAKVNGLDHIFIFLIAVYCVGCKILL